MEELGGALLMLRAKYDTLILSERRVADYVLENPLEVSQCTATQLAKAVQVSKTTVIRLCQTLGYQGYHDFKYALIHDVAKRDTDIFDDIFPADSPYEILKKVLEQLPNKKDTWFSNLGQGCIDTIFYSKDIRLNSYETIEV